MNKAEKILLAGIIISGIIISVGAITENKSQAIIGLVFYCISTGLFVINGE